MKEPTQLQKQQYKRFTEILETGKQRYIEATGSHRGYKAGIKGQDYLTDEERKEASLLFRQMFVIPSNNTSSQSQDKSDSLTDDSTLLPEQVEAES